MVRGKGNAVGHLSKAPFSELETEQEVGTARTPKPRKQRMVMNVFPLHFNAFPKAFLHSGAVGSRECGSGLAGDKGFCCWGVGEWGGSRAELVCGPSAGPPAVGCAGGRGLGFWFFFPGVCVFWVLLSFLLTTVVRKFSSLDLGCSHTKIAWLPPGVRQKESLSFDLKWGRVCCHCHHHSLLFSDSRVSTWEAQGLDWLSHGPRRSWRRWLACLNGFRDVCGGGGGGGVQNGSRGQRKVSPGKRASQDGEGPYFPSPARRSCLWIAPFKHLFLPPCSCYESVGGSSPNPKCRDSGRCLMPTIK